MANLQLNIEVNDEQFADICSNNIENLPKDKMEELLLKAVEVALIADKEKPYYDNDNNILVSKVEKRNNYYTSYEYKPTDLLMEIIKRVDLSPYMDKMAEVMRDYILNNYEEMIKKYIVESFAKMLFSDQNRYEFRDSIVRQMSNYMNDNRG